MGSPDIIGNQGFEDAIDGGYALIAENLAGMRAAGRAGLTFYEPEDLASGRVSETEYRRAWGVYKAEPITQEDVKKAIVLKAFHGLLLDFMDLREHEGAK